ncbi:hypothetical protein SLE2022_333190 [Rubroshorea leprosula]
MKNYSSLVLRRALLLMMIFLVAESLRVSPQYQFGLKGRSMEPGDPVRSQGRRKGRGGREEAVRNTNRVELARLFPCLWSMLPLQEGDGELQMLHGVLSNCL